MKVTLIDYTGAGCDPMYAARLLIYTKDTRLEQGDDTRNKVRNMSNEEVLKQLDYISKTIRSSWEFLDYTFEIKDVTRAFTHQLVRTRTGSYAQQSQRSVDMDGFSAVMPDSIKDDVDRRYAWDHAMLGIKNGYTALKDLGVPTQDCRGVLPTNVCTNIIAKFNLRTIADLVGKRQNLRAQGEYADVVKLMAAEMLLVHPWVHPFLYPERLQTPRLDALLKEALGGRTPAAVPELNEALKELDALKGTWG
jgi:flavin-dependent thymidylate synthase